MTDATAKAVMSYVDKQEAARGAWPSPRPASQPDFPWPDADNAMLRYLEAAQGRLNAGERPAVVMLHLAVHAWFEGGIDAWDRAQRDHLTPPPAG